MPGNIPIPIPVFVDDFKPSFEIMEDTMPDISERKIGQTFQAIINYKVVEKTKSFTVVRVKSIFMMPSKRRF